MKLVDGLIMRIMQRKLERMKKQQNTPYIFIKGTENDYPRYLMYTDDEHIRKLMHRIY